MKRNTSSYLHRDERFKQLRSEDSESGLRLRTEDERLQHRREEWMIQQEREREHEKLKKKMILEYELRRAREKKLALSKRSKTKSRSPEIQDRNNASNTSKTFILFEKSKSSDDTSLFRGPEGTQISATELRKIKVDIHRVLPGKPTTTTDEVKRDIINPEDVMVKRRTGKMLFFVSIINNLKIYHQRSSKGEGSKPIFEREEIKNVFTHTSEITEHGTVLVVNIERSENEITCKNHAVSSNSSRGRSFQHTSSRYSSFASQKIEEMAGLNKNICHLLCQHYLPVQKEKGVLRERSCSRDRNKEYKKKDRQYEKLRTDNEKEKLSQEKTSRKRYSRSREQEQKSYKNENSYREYREPSRARSRDRRERERSGERKKTSSLLNNYNYSNNYNNNNYNNNYNNNSKKLYYNINYIEQIPVPVYYGNFPPNPIMVRPWVPMQEQIPRFRYIGPLTSFPPRFIPPNMYRRLPLNPRFRPMY
uniref:Complementary sex determiner n=1 Tax=Apis cerana TaxID=7461 RepID=B1NW59_APICE|nr:calponin homology domain-containing protein DDB_G0272472-like [Apis cerana]ABV58880.1 complementary sex determiner [Apis cerana]